MRRYRHQYRINHKSQPQEWVATAGGRDDFDHTGAKKIKMLTELLQMFGQQPSISLNDCSGQRISLEPPKLEIWLRQCQRDIKCLFTHLVKLKATASTENCGEGSLEMTRTNEENLNTEADLEQTRGVCQRVCR